MDELDAPVRRVVQRVEDLAVEDEGAVDLRGRFERAMERRVVEVAQVAPEPTSARDGAQRGGNACRSVVRCVRDIHCARGTRRLQFDTMPCPMNLTHHFLIAMPSMADPHFAHTLTYVCEHNPDGALGIVVNKPIDMTLSALFEQIDIPLADSALRESPVHFGGPVQIDRGFVLHRPLGNWQSTLAICDDMGLTTSKDVLEAVGRGEGPKDVFVSLGYAGWSAGQLEQELAQNAWLTVAADPDVLFDDPAEERLPAAMRLLGIDFSRLSDAVGHA